MSFAALLTERARVYAREAGQEHWRPVSAGPVACRVVALSPREAEMALARRRAEVTHRGRCEPSPDVRAGRKLVLADGREYLVVAVTSVARPAPSGHLVLELEALPAT
jgi:hypothetical protein